MAKFSVVTRDAKVGTSEATGAIARLKADQAALHAALLRDADGFRVVHLADAALVEVNSLLDRAVRLTRQAASAAPGGATTLDAEYQTIAAEIERIQHALNGGAPPEGGPTPQRAEVARETRQPEDPLPIEPSVHAAPLEAEQHWLKQAFAALRLPAEPTSAVEASGAREDRTNDLVRRAAREIADRPHTAALVQAGVNWSTDDSLLR